MSLRVCCEHFATMRNIAWCNKKQKRIIGKDCEDCKKQEEDENTSRNIKRICAHY